MCKLLFFSKIYGLKIQENLGKILKVLEQGNKDGLGIFGENGHIKGLDISDIISERKNIMPFLRAKKSNRDSHGELFNTSSLAMHSRTSTNKLGINYCHPFKVGNNYFAHNGIVDVPKNHNYDLKTTNDSEYLASLYAHKKETGLDSVSGYYAFIHYDFDTNTWHIVRDDTAQLSCAYIPENDSFIFATKERDITDICKILGVSYDYILDVNSYTKIHFKKGNYIDSTSVPVKLSSRKKDDLFYKSMGSIETENNIYSIDSMLLNDDRFFATSDSQLDDYQQGLEDGMNDKQMGVKFSNSELLEYSEEYYDGYFEGYYYDQISIEKR